jgi:hypothetical protein
VRLSPSLLSRSAASTADGGADSASASSSDVEEDADAVLVPCARAAAAAAAAPGVASPPLLLRLSPWRHSGADAFFAPEPTAEAVATSSSLSASPSPLAAAARAATSAGMMAGRPRPAPLALRFGAGAAPHMALPLTPVGDASSAPALPLTPLDGAAPVAPWAAQPAAASAAAAGRSASACSSPALGPSTPDHTLLGAAAAMHANASDSDLFAFDDDVWTPRQLGPGDSLPPLRAASLDGAAFAAPPHARMSIDDALAAARDAAEAAEALAPRGLRAARDSFYADEDDLDGAGWARGTSGDGLDADADAEGERHARGGGGGDEEDWAETF